jgi:hypothetical protein
MGLIRNAGSNVSISQNHLYSKEKVLKAKSFLEEWGKNQRYYPLEDIVRVYNELKGTNEVASNCRACANNKFIAGIQNYYKYGRLTLENWGVKFDWSTAEQIPAEIPIENEENRIITSTDNYHDNSEKTVLEVGNDNDTSNNQNSSLIEISNIQPDVERTGGIVSKKKHKAGRWSDRIK